MASSLKADFGVQHACYEKRRGVKMNKKQSPQIIVLVLFFLLGQGCAFLSHDDELALMRKSQVTKTVTQTDGWISYDGLQYRGQMKGKRPHGKGEYKEKNGSTYKGSIKLGLRDGDGLWSLSNGWRYEGRFSNDDPHGKGILYFPDGSLYEGQFVKGYINGNGLLKAHNGYRLQGEFGATDKKSWQFKGLIREKSGWQWCSGNFNMTKTKHLDGKFRSYTALLDSYLNYLSNLKCQLVKDGPSYNERSLAYTKAAFNSDKFWLSLKTKPYIDAEYLDGSTLKGTSNKPKLNGVFNWALATEGQKSIQVWKNGKLFASSPSGKWAAKLIADADCQVKNHNSKWLVVEGKCKNGWLNDPKGTVISVDTQMPNSLVGHFVNGQLHKGQKQEVQFNKSTGVLIKATQADEFHINQKGQVAPAGLTVISTNGRVFFQGEFKKNGVGSGACLHNGGYEKCLLNTNGYRIDEIAQARNQIKQAQDQARHKREQQLLKEANCNQAIRYMDQNLDDMVRTFDDNKCVANYKKASRVLQDQISGNNFWGNDRELTKETRKCLDREKRYLDEDLNTASSNQRAIRRACSGIEGDFLPQMISYKRSIADNFRERQSEIKSKLAELDNLRKKAKRAMQIAKDQRREQAHRDLMATIRRHGDHNSFLDSIGADRSSTGAMAQSQRILSNYNKTVFRKQREYQDAYQSAIKKSKRLDASRPSYKPDTSRQKDAYKRAKKSCERTRDTWNETSKTCTPTNRITVHNINLLPAACFGEGPHCKQSQYGYAVPNNISGQNSSTFGQTSNTDTSENSDGWGRYAPTGWQGNETSSHSDANEKYGSKSSNRKSDAKKDKPTRRALAVSWQLKSGRWKAFGPTQGDLGVAENTETEALRAVGCRSGALLTTRGKYHIYDVGRPLSSSDLNVYRYAKRSESLDLSNWQ